MVIKQEVWEKIKKCFTFNQLNVISYRLLNRPICKLDLLMVALFVSHTEADFLL